MTVGVIAEYIESDLVPGTNITIVPNVPIKILFAYASITATTSSSTASVTTTVTDRNTNFNYYNLMNGFAAGTTPSGSYTTTQYILGTGVQIVISVSSGSGNAYFDIVYMELE